MACACIDIGTNTTRLLVAEAGPDGLRELLTQRVFTRVRRAQGPDGRIGDAKLTELVDVVASQARAARALGCTTIHAVATAAIRDAPNRDELVAAVRQAADIELDVLTAEREARLAFRGATRSLERPPAGRVAVVDLGGGSTEIAIGTPPDAVAWWTSVPVGSGTLADTHLRADPPTAREIEALREHAAGAFADLDPPRVELALAVGGSATSLRRLAGPRLDPASLSRALDELAAWPTAEVARRHDLDPERVRLLPGALAVLEQAAGAFGAPLDVARGGLREGLVLDALERERRAAGA